MKIYAYGVPDMNIPTPFDQYVGQDVWVLCRLTYSYKDFYIRFLDKHVSYFTVNSIFPADMDNLRAGKIPNDKIRKLLTKTDTMFAKNLEIVEPLTVIPSAEILPNIEQYETTESIVDRYVGKDLWVKITVGKTMISQHRYMKFTNKDGFYVSGPAIRAEYIDYHEGFDPDEDVYSTMHPWRPSRYHIDDITVPTPVQVLTTEEVEEELSLCALYDELDEDNEWDDEDESEETDE